jgi:hypothetical protein
MKILETSKDGSYKLAGIQNTKVRSFSHSDKNNGLGGIYQNCKEASKAFFIQGKVPGPGSYKLPSDFGHYESKENDAKNHLHNSENLEKN